MQDWSVEASALGAPAQTTSRRTRRRGPRSSARRNKQFQTRRQGPPPRAATSRRRAPPRPPGTYHQPTSRTLTAHGACSLRPPSRPPCPWGTMRTMRLPVHNYSLAMNSSNSATAGPRRRCRALLRARWSPMTPIRPQSLLWHRGSCCSASGCAFCSFSKHCSTPATT